MSENKKLEKLMSDDFVGDEVELWYRKGKREILDELQKTNLFLKKIWDLLEEKFDVKGDGL